MSWRLGFATAISLAALIVLACGPSGNSSIESGSGTEVIPPATERPAGLDGFLRLPDSVEPIAFAWSEVTVRRSTGDLRVGVLVADSGDSAHSRADVLVGSATAGWNALRLGGPTAAVARVLESQRPNGPPCRLAG